MSTKVLAAREKMDQDQLTSEPERKEAEISSSEPQCSGKAPGKVRAGVGVKPAELMENLN